VPITEVSTRTSSRHRGHEDSSERDESKRPGMPVGWLAAGAVAVLGLGVWLGTRLTTPPSEPDTIGSVGQTAEPQSTVLVSPPLVTLAPQDLSLLTAPSPTSYIAPGPESSGTQLPEDALNVANGLIDRLNSGEPLSQADVDAVARLSEEYPGDTRIQDLHLNVLVSASIQAQGRRAYPEALGYAEEALSRFPDHRLAHQAQLEALSGLQDWQALETAARDFLRLEPDHPMGHRALAFSIAGQGRSKEALRATYAALATRDEAELAALRDNLERKLWAESGCDDSQLPRLEAAASADLRLERFLNALTSCPGAAQEMRLAHFTVRSKEYSRLPTDEARRETVRLLERHYALLARRLDHDLSSPVPVVLHIGYQGYQEATGAPGWSGGVFDTEDFRIDIPLPHYDLERVTLHELAHAFIHDMSAGRAPRELHEGLAQYIEGWRLGGAERSGSLRDTVDFLVQLCETVRTPNECAKWRDEVYGQFRLVAMGQVTSVGFRYLADLSFMDFLVRQRTLAGVRDALKRMGQGDTVDEALRRTYGRDLSQLKQAWLERLRVELGSGGTPS